MKSNPLIFIVDDDKAYSRLLEVYLKKNNYNNVKCFYTGEDCLKHFYLKPDLILLDYNLAGSDPNKLDGFQVLGKINGIFQNPTVIMMSGEMHQDAKKIIEAKFEKGMYKYIMKSNNALNELIQAINEMITGLD